MGCRLKGGDGSKISKIKSQPKGPIDGGVPYSWYKSRGIQHPLDGLVHGLVHANHELKELNLGV